MEKAPNNFCSQEFYIEICDIQYILTLSIFGEEKLFMVLFAVKVTGCDVKYSNFVV